MIIFLPRSFVIKNEPLCAFSKYWLGYCFHRKFCVDFECGLRPRKVNPLHELSNSSNSDASQSSVFFTVHLL
ncbi:hypothetical protein ACOSP7_022682 [Xanthoceras sorbifolium]